MHNPIFFNGFMIIMIIEYVQQLSLRFAFLNFQNLMEKKDYRKTLDYLILKY